MASERRAFALTALQLQRLPRGVVWATPAHSGEKRRYQPAGIQMMSLARSWPGYGRESFRLMLTEILGQQQRVDQDAHMLNQVPSLRLALGLDVVVDEGTGEVRCRNEFIGCVPVNLFGINSVTPEMADFLATTRLNTETFERQIIGGSLSGEHVESFGGINNVFDNEPTPVGFFSGGDPNVDPSTHDVLGRRYFAGTKYIF